MTLHSSHSYTALLWQLFVCIAYYEGNVTVSGSLLLRNLWAGRAADGRSTERMCMDCTCRTCPRGRFQHLVAQFYPSSSWLFFHPFSTPPWRWTQQDKRKAIIWDSWSSNQIGSAKSPKIKQCLKPFSIFEAVQARKVDTAQLTARWGVTGTYLLQTVVMMVQKKEWAFTERKEKIESLLNILGDK